VAAGALVVVILLIALGVHSCQVSATENALKDYSDSVYSLITRSNSNSQQLFGVLSNGGGSSNATTLQNEVNAARGTADKILSDAQAYGAPDQVKSANQNLLLALRMRADGIEAIGNDIQPALANSAASTGAVDDIAKQMARFYASDVLYKFYALPDMVGALHADSIGVGGTNGQAINGHQFLPDVQWLTPGFVAAALHATAPGLRSTKIAPGLHGHALDSVSVAGTTLQTGSTNTIPAKPAPTFTLNFANTGTNNETDVVCKVTVSGTGISGTATVPETIAGKPATCQVTLSSSPPSGTYTVVATIEKVPGETNLANNTLSFPVTFQ
jgi:hypothetical protein